MRLFLRLSFRNLWRNKRRTIITMSAMAFATALLIMTMGLTEGMIRDSLESATGLYHGHAKITAKNYLEERELSMTLPGGQPPASIAQDKGVYGVAGRVRGYALLSAGRDKNAETQPAELLGVDPAQEAKVSDLANRIATGSAFTDASSNGILLGTTLARRLNAKVGDEVIAMGQAVDGSVAPGIFKVVGLIDTGETSLNASLALVGRTTLQSMQGLEGRVHEWVIALKDPMEAREWAQAARAGVTEGELNSWHKLLPQMAAVVDKIGISKAFTAIIFYFGVILVTVNTMYMAQLERLREFAVMGAIGLKPRRLMSLIVIEGALMSSIAAIVGGVAGAALSLNMMVNPWIISKSGGSISMAGTTMQTAMRSAPTWDSFVLPILLVVLLGGLISLFPAWKLGRLRPVDALREV